MGQGENIPVCAYSPCCRPAAGAGVCPPSVGTPAGKGPVSMSWITSPSIHPPRGHAARERVLLPAETTGSWPRPRCSISAGVGGRRVGFGGCRALGGPGAAPTAPAGRVPVTSRGRAPLSPLLSCSRPHPRFPAPSLAPSLQRGRTAGGRRFFFAELFQIPPLDF